MSVAAASTSVESSARIRVFGEWIAASAVILTCVRPFLTGAFLARPAITDRGTFIAYGKLVADGAVMYRDVWDNKPPVIHLLSALAWSVSPHVTAAYQMERVALLLGGAMLFAMLRHALGFRFLPALCGLLVALVALRNPEVFTGGYSTEEFGIVFETAAIACLGLGLRTENSRVERVWQCAFGVFAAVTILTRQTFVAALTVLWLAAHAPLVRRPRRLVGAIAWEAAGVCIPTASWLVYLWRTGGVAQFLELLPETFASGSVSFMSWWNLTPHARLGVGVPHWSPAASGDSLAAHAIRGIEWLIAIVFHDDWTTAILLAIVGTIAVVAATAERRRGRRAMRITPLVLPFWFVAELAVASAPGNYFGPYYLPFVPFWACLIALIVDVCMPTTLVPSFATVGRAVALLALVGMTSWSLDAWYRIDPTRYWWVFVTDVHIPAPLVAQLRPAPGSDSRYVPLLTNSPEILLDMPLKPGTRFLAQYPFQFDGPGSPRGRELVRDLSAADVVVEDRNRLRLDRDLEAQIQSTLRTAFVPAFDWLHFQFYRRRAPSGSASGAADESL